MLRVNKLVKQLTLQTSALIASASVIGVLIFSMANKIFIPLFKRTADHNFLIALSSRS